MRKGSVRLSTVGLSSGTGSSPSASGVHGGGLGPSPHSAPHTPQDSKTGFQIWPIWVGDQTRWWDVCGQTAQQFGVVHLGCNHWALNILNVGPPGCLPPAAPTSPLYSTYPCLQDSDRRIWDEWVGPMHSPAVHSAPHAHQTHRLGYWAIGPLHVWSSLATRGVQHSSCC